MVLRTGCRVCGWSGDRGHDHDRRTVCHRICHPGGSRSIYRHRIDYHDHHTVCHGIYRLHHPKVVVDAVDTRHTRDDIPPQPSLRHKGPVGYLHGREVLRVRMVSHCTHSGRIRSRLFAVVYHSLDRTQTAAAVGRNHNLADLHVTALGHSRNYVVRPLIEHDHSLHRHILLAAEAGSSLDCTGDLCLPEDDAAARSLAGLAGHRWGRRHGAEEGAASCSLGAVANHSLDIVGDRNPVAAPEEVGTIDCSRGLAEGCCRRLGPKGLD